MTGASARPARLTRFEDAHHAACDGLYRRCGALDDALAVYRATCAAEYRAGTVDAVGALDDWRGSYRAFATWVGDVGRAFLAAEAVEAYMNGYGHVDVEAVSTLSEEAVLEQLDDRWADDPYLGVVDAATGAISAEAAPWVADLVAGDQDEPPPWVAAVGDGSFGALVVGVMTEETARVLAGLPRGVDVVVRAEAASIVVLRDGSVVATFTRAEVAARVLVPRDTTALRTASRWLGRVSNATTFLVGAATQWDGDDGLPTDERLLRAITRGGGSLLGGMGGGALAGASAGTVCGPGAPICSGALAIGGAVVGAFLGDRVVDFLPWMDDPEPLPLDRDLDAVADLVADGGPAEMVAPAQAVVDLMGRDAAAGAAEPGSWDEYFLAQVLPDRDALLDVVDPPEDAPPTGTTTTTTTPTTLPPPGPLPVPPAPPAVPVPAPPPAPPTGTTVPSTTVPGG